MISLLAGGGALAAQQPAAPQELVVRKLDFDGNRSISDEILASVIATTNSSWFATSPVARWIGLGEKRYFDSREFQADVLRLQVFYIRSGYPDVTVDTVVRREPRDIYITFKIHEGLPVRVDTLSVLGLDSFPRQVQQKILTDLPLRVGDVFNRFLMQADADTIVRRLKDHGYPSADVFTSFESRAADRTATIVLAVVPGTRAWISQLHVAGTDRVDSGTVTAFVSARPGERFSQSDLYQSQRNLYQSDLFRFAAVNIDTTGYRPGSDSVPLLIQVNESRPYRVRGGLGYGTTDCFR
ncbi:MAG TPA: POTRA domain-containing protein, partial [Gemmatimonadales bacterium]|nr:POTRA domain-containing protein [Gemmatimonadales bacterium]